MNGCIFAIEVGVLVILFTFMIIVPLCKNPVWWIHDYPKDIQEEYFKPHERIPSEDVPFCTCYRWNGSWLNSMFADGCSHPYINVS